MAVTWNGDYLVVDAFQFRTSPRNDTSNIIKQSIVRHRDATSMHERWAGSAGSALISYWIHSTEPVTHLYTSVH